MAEDGIRKYVLEKDIFWLDISVDDILFMQIVQSTSNDQQRKDSDEIKFYLCPRIQGRILQAP